MNGGFPAAQSNLSRVEAAHSKKSAAWTTLPGAAALAARTAESLQSTPALGECIARNRPSPHAGSSRRSSGRRTAQRTKAAATRLGE